VDKIRLGIIGLGRIGKIHMENLWRRPDVELVAASDPFLTAETERWAAGLGVRRLEKDSAAIVGDPDIDAVLICSPTDTHASLIAQAAACGKHIFCEKPVSLDVRETAKALEKVKQAGVKLQIGFNRRFDRNFRRIREHVLLGTIGTPHLVKITSRDPAPPSEAYIASSGGLFMDMMIHDFDLARYLTGSEVTEVYAQGAVLVDPVFARHGDVDTAIVTLKFESGAIGVIDNSRRAVYGYDQRVEVFGSGGSAAAANEYPNAVEVSTDAGVSRDKPLHFFLERYRDAYREELDRFVASVLRDEPIAVDGNDGYQAELIALAARLSHRTGRPVRTDEALELADRMGADAGVRA
jgi:myo-inositol 2-dehydrogenase/D-chiro-inositol 1-dehydrogenase